LASFGIAHKIDLLLATPPRAGLQHRLVPTMPSADSYDAFKDNCLSSQSGLGSLAAPDTPQASRGKLMRFQCTTAGFTPVVLDGYGLRALTRTRPTSAPPIQFLCVGSHLCSTLPSDPTSRWMPLCFARLHLHQVGRGTYTLQVHEHARHTSCTTRKAGGLMKAPRGGQQTHYMKGPQDPQASSERG
jgi:hypothetical protein